MKKLVSVLLSIMMVLSLAACGNGSSETGSNEEKYKDRERTFTLCYYEGGFGSDWLQAVVEDYMDNVNTDVYISLKSSTDNETARQKIASQTGTYDLYYIEVDMFEKGNVLEELTGLLDMEVPGETGVKVRDKIGQTWVDYYTEDGQIYQMPATNFLGWNWSYNKTLLDETLGEGYWTLPKTTDELFAIGETLFNKNVFLTTFAGNDTTGGADYLRYCYEVWFAQMTGLEGYGHYYNCEYKDGDQYVVAKDSPKNIEQNKTAIEETYKVAETLCQGQNGVEYIHSKCESLSFIDAQFLLYQGGFKGANEYPIAFYYNTAAGEQEMLPYIKDGIIEEQDVRMMKMPVMSAIIQRTPSIADDATLSAVIDYVDGTVAEAPVGVSETDIEIVKEARNMMVELVCREWVITKDAENKDDIKDFLAYLTSDQAQKLAAKECNGLPVLNYGYVPTDEDMGFTISEYGKSVQKISSEAVVVDYAHFDKKLGRFVGLTWYKDKTTSGGTLCENLYTKQALEADEIYQSTLDSFASTWKDRVAQYYVQNQE